MEAPAPVRDEAVMRLALAEAQKAFDLGEVPVGAVVYRPLPDGSFEVLATAFNLRESTADPAAHAELIAMREAAKKIGSWRLDGCEVAVTLEPCPMCAGLMVNARLSRCVWGAPDAKMGCAGTLHQLLDEPRFNHRVAHAGGVLAVECAKILQDFFKLRRSGERPEKPRPPAAPSA
jgi:tRNA(adenine34) deaminase